MTLLDVQELQRTIACWTSVLGAPIEALRPDQLADEQARGTVLWDVRSRQAFDAGHVEGARSLGSIDWLLADAFGGNLVPRPVIASRLAEIGITADRRVIVHGTPGSIDVLIALRGLRAIGVRNLAVCYSLPSPSPVPATA